MDTMKSWMAEYSAKFWTVCLCLFGSLLFVIFQGGKLALMVFIIMSLLTAYLALGRWSGIAEAKGVRTLGNISTDMAIEAGTSVSVRIDLNVPGYWPIPYVILKDKLIRNKGESQMYEATAVLDWKRHGNVEYFTAPLRRGHYHFGGSECLTEDVFGLFEHKGSLEMSRSFSVLPATVPIKEWRQFHRMIKGEQHHSTTTQAHRETTQINGVREYIYGDRISRIHWNATARTGTWKSKEFEKESLPKTVIVIDRTQSSYSDTNQFELAVSTAASLFQFATQQDLSLGLLSVGASKVFLEPKRSAHHHQMISNHMIDVEADGRHSLIDVLKQYSRLFTQGCFFVIVSPQKDEAMLQVLSWLSGRQMNPCHMWIASEQQPAAQQIWQRQLASKGFMGYTIRTLQELPVALGGRSE